MHLIPLRLTTSISLIPEKYKLRSIHYNTGQLQRIFCHNALNPSTKANSLQIPDETDTEPTQYVFYGLRFLFSFLQDIHVHTMPVSVTPFYDIYR